MEDAADNATVNTVISGIAKAVQSVDTAIQKLAGMRAVLDMSTGISPQPIAPTAPTKDAAITIKPVGGQQDAALADDGLPPDPSCCSAAPSSGARKKRKPRKV